MAIVFRNNAEGGTLMATATAGNSGGGSGNAFNVVTTNTGSIIYHNSIVYNGAQSYAIYPGAGATCFVQPGLTATTAATCRFYLYLTSYPTSATQLVSGQASAAGMGDLALNTNGRLIVQVSGVTDAGYTNTYAIPLYRWMRVEIALGKGVDTVTGYISVSLYDDSIDPLTPVVSYTNSACNTGTNNLVRFLIGKVSATGNWALMHIDDIAIIDSIGTVGPAYPSKVSAPWLAA
jgi:hypothetical protein